MTVKRALKTTSSDSSPTKKIKYKVKLNVLRNEYKKNQKKIKNQNELIRRRNAKIKKLSAVLNNLHENNFITATEYENLKEMSLKSGALLSRFLVKAKGKKVPKKYPAVLKSFALTLHFYSPKAYDYVRKEFNLCLPHPKTLSTWYMAIDAKPGFTSESFELLEKAVNSAIVKNKTIIANLVFDEMSIRKKIEWNFNKEEMGYVYDFGLGNYNATPAREVLVFLLVAINASWKLPLGYFPIDGCKSEQKFIITKFCIEKIFKVGVDLVGVTFDGCPANISMAKLFGCEFNGQNASTFKLKDGPYKDKTLIITLDPCHAIKLVRNAFAKKRIIIDENGEEINWKFLERLVELQEAEELHLGNKLSKAHTEFKNQIMKVRLATQLMSDSVADAISYCCNGLKLTNFENSDATVKFLKIMNCAFDILNSHNLSQKGFKKAICASNFQSINNSAQECINYISSLKFKRSNDTEFVINSTRKTGFLGIMMGLQNISFLFEEYIATGKLLFVPFYKLSQDHIELFFCSSRQRLGFNNNPTVKQFMTTYQRLLGHCEISDKGIGNCIPLEEIKILNVVSSVDTINASAPMRILIESDETPVSFSSNDEIFLNDHDYLFDPSRLTEYSKNVVEYIAGFIVRYLHKKLNCESCLEVLIGNTVSAISLINFKNRGGLTTPAPDVIMICDLVEKEIRCILANRTNSTKIVSRESFLKISINVQNKLLTKNVFPNLEYHAHYSLLPKSIIETFIHIRFFYITKSYNTKISQRTRLNHLILFQNM